MFRLLSLARRLPLDPHRGTFFMRGFSRGDAVSAGKDCTGLVEACTPCAGWQAHQIWDSMMIIQVAILPLHHRGLVVAAAAAVESKRHQATADHQPEYDPVREERIAPIAPFNGAGVCRPPVIGTEQGRGA